MPNLRPALALALAGAVFLVALAAAPPAAHAAGLAPARTTAPPPARSSRTDVTELQKLVATLNDESKRQALVTQLETLIAAARAQEAAVPESPGARVLAALSHRIDALSHDLAGAATAVIELPAIVARAAAALGDPQVRSRWFQFLWKVALVLVAGALAELAARRLLARVASALEARTDGVDWWTRLALLLARTVLDLASLAAFALVAYGLLPALEPSQITRLVALTLINASVLARAVGLVGRSLLAPRSPGLRVVHIADETANYWTLWVRRLANVSVYGYFLIEVASLLGLRPPAHDFLLDLLGLAITAMLVVLVQQNRGSVAALVRGPETDAEGAWARTREHAADLWHLLANAYLIAVFTVWAMKVQGGFQYIARATVLSALVLVLGAAARFGYVRGLRRLFALSDELKARYPGLEARANRYVPILRGLGSALIYLVVVLAVLQAWGVDVVEWFSGATGREMLSRVLTVGAIIVVSVTVWELISAAIEFWLHRMDAGGARSARLFTLLPLARKAIFVVMVVMVTLTVLSELGLNIGPLLAGASVVGLAVGFGAQTLVKDVITGVFILVEDTVDVGDYVEVAGHAGTVESLSIRTISLRDPEGNVHTLPFSEVTSVLNYTKEYSFALMDIGVAYREDVDEVIKVIEQLGAELQADASVGVNVLEPIQVLGLQSLDDSAVTIRARIKTVPGRQWATRREFYRRMKRRFDELGIEIPFPHRTIYFGEDKQGRAPAAPVRLEARADSSDVAPPPADAAGA